MSVENIAGGQFLTFMLDEEVYAVEITQVREVLDLTKITKIPRMPDFMRGVINLRGGVVPIVDLRKKFGMDAVEESVNTCIIIIELNIDDETTLFGAIADSVKEVIMLEMDSIGAAPHIGTRVNTDFIRGMSKKDDDFIILLDIARVFSVADLETVQDIHQAETEELENSENEEEVVSDTL